MLPLNPHVADVKNALVPSRHTLLRITRIKNLTCKYKYGVEDAREHEAETLANEEIN
jgi:hypothetical protein